MPLDSGPASPATSAGVTDGFRHASARAESIAAQLQAGEIVGLGFDPYGLYARLQVMHPVGWQAGSPETVTMSLTLPKLGARRAPALYLPLKLGQEEIIPADDGQKLYRFPLERLPECLKSIEQMAASRAIFLATQNPTRDFCR